ncbi:MAG: winged helix-turn-helix transcriptional regulator [Maritimibacter sp.]|nr:winged helix-turn-helix transcriptional regulator [Maritimibacter sp.]
MSTDQTIARSFNALAHPRRVRLFRLLIETPERGTSVTALQIATGFEKAALLHHLTVMERAGLITRRRRGSSVAQAITPGPLAAAMAEVTSLTRSATPAVRAV